MTIVKREGLGRPMTWGELDGNFDAVEALRTEAAQSVAQSGANANASAASAGVAENARDEALEAAAQVENDLIRVIKAPEGEVMGELPVTADRTDTLLGFGSNGQPVVHPVADFVQYDDNGNIPLPVEIQANTRELWRRTLAEAGITLVNGSFQESATVQNANEAVWDIDGAQCYTWSGTFPHDAESSPGVGWVSVEHLRLTASSVYLSNGYSVEDELDVLTEKIVYATRYGVKADGRTDDTNALQNLSKAVSAMTSPFVRVVFPAGTSLVGQQDKAVSASDGYSFRPSYIKTVGNQGWFYIRGRPGKTIIEAWGYTLKLNSGLRHGSFDPITGAIYPTVLPFRDVNYQASAGNLATFKDNENITIFGLHCDGNARGSEWGGKFGDSGWQCISFGIWDSHNLKLIAVACHSFDCLTDSAYKSMRTGWVPSNDETHSSTYDHCEFYNSRRQGITIAGGENIKLNNTSIYNIGRKAFGAGEHYSAPEACLDIETESSPVYDVTAHNSTFKNARYTLLAASFPHPFSRARFYECTFSTDSDLAQMYITGGGVRIMGGVIEGSGIDLRSDTDTWPELRGVTLRNHIRGEPSQFCRYVGSVGVMEDCFFDITVNNINMTSSPPMFGMAGQGNFPGQGLFHYNRIRLTGNQDVITPASNGRIYLGSLQSFVDMDLRVITRGLSGVIKLDIDTAGSTVNQRGITSDSNLVVDQGTGSSLLLSSGGYLLPRTVRLYASSLAPAVTGMTLGSDTRRMGDMFIGPNGVNMQSPNGTKWRFFISDAGAMTVIPQG